MWEKSVASACARLGLGALREKQASVLGALARGESVFAALPTGYGKSLCYWMPAAAWGWRVLVISPLVSLIEDQALACEALGLSVVAWRGGLSAERRRSLAARTRCGDWQICFLSPERFVRWSAAGFPLPRLNLIALDEMHCLNDWRHFRAGYRDLEAPLRQALAGGVPLLGLSASLPATASQAWMSRFTCAHHRVEASLGRENLQLRVVPLERERDRWLWLLEALRGLSAPDSALVYCFSREEADDVARWLRSAGISAVAFHAGLPADERSERTRAFRAGRLRVICATSAFGMGIDYPFVARVIHFSMPRDLESYWQEVGRAGRSGQPAKGVALWRRSEIARSRILSPEAREKFFSLWSAWASGRCRKVVVAEQLGLAQEACGKCDRCLDAQICAWWARPEAELSRWVSERKFSDAEVKRTLGSAAAKSF